MEEKKGVAVLIRRGPIKSCENTSSYRIRDRWERGLSKMGPGKPVDRFVEFCYKPVCHLCHPQATILRHIPHEHDGRF